MDFSLTDEQQQWRAQTRRVLAGTPGWPGLAAAGWWDPGLPMLARVLVAVECGYALCPVPWVTRLALPAGVAGAIGDGPVAVAELRVTGGLADGRADEVLDASADAALLIPADDGVWLVSPGSPGYTVTPGTGLDERRVPATVVCTRAPARRVADGPLDGVREQVLLAAEAVGVAERAYDLAAAHARTRTQFGRPIGAFQAVAFGIADSWIRIELAWSLVLRAGWLLDEDDPAAGLAARVAATSARRAALRNTEQTLQVLGGMGMTWEHPLHHWHRRALWLDRRGPSGQETLAGIAGALLD
jgi:hypothetical protein